jgi:hypothetical protein
VRAGRAACCAKRVSAEPRHEDESSRAEGERSDGWFGHEKSKKRGSCECECERVRRAEFESGISGCVAAHTVFQRQVVQQCVKRQRVFEKRQGVRFRRQGVCGGKECAGESPQGQRVKFKRQRPCE